jgi:transcription antitermination protein NusB
VTDYPVQDPNNADDIEDGLSIPDDHGRERSAARWLALQVLYEVDSTHHLRGEVLTHHLGRYDLLPVTREYTYKLVNGVLDNQPLLDQILQTVATEYPLDQVAVIDRNLLRIAVYEYSLLGHLPIGVVTDEAVRLAKHFGADSAPRFVNGVLGGVFANKTELTALIDSYTPTDNATSEDTP